MSNWYITPSDKDLVHYGVLGMKWGVRRYQNKDGSLTSAGRKHYGSKDIKLKDKPGNLKDIKTNNPLPSTYKKEFVKQTRAITNKFGEKENAYEVYLNGLTSKPISIKETINNNGYKFYETDSDDATIWTNNVTNNQKRKIKDFANDFNIAKKISKECVGSTIKKIFEESKNEDWIKKQGIDDKQLKDYLINGIDKPSIYIKPSSNTPGLYDISCTIFPSYESPFGGHMLSVDGYYDSNKNTIKFANYGYEMNG